MINPQRWKVVGTLLKDNWAFTVGYMESVGVRGLEEALEIAAIFQCEGDNIMTVIEGE
jgi:hypothetical protein